MRNALELALLLIIATHRSVDLLVKVGLLQFVHARVVLDLGVCRILDVPGTLLALGLSDARVTVRLGHTRISISLHGGRLRLAQRLQVLHVIVHVLDGEGQDLDAHPTHVRCCHFSDQRGKLVAIFVHLFDCKRSCKGGDTSGWIRSADAVALNDMGSQN